RYFGGVWLEAGRLRWLEYRADEGGRGVLVEQLDGGDPRDVSPPGFNVRTRVHEYGGGAAWVQGEKAFCASFDDSRLYRIDGAGAEPRPLTREPGRPHGLRFADGCVTPDGATVICVREAIFQPEWDWRGALHFSSDSTGWWNLHRLEPDGSVTPLTNLEGAEIGSPGWVFGMRRYAFLDDGRVACVVTRAATDSLQLLELASARLEPVELEWTEYTA